MKMVVTFLSISSISLIQSVTLDHISSNHSLGKGTLELGRITVGFSKKPNITRVDKDILSTKQKEIALVCADVVCAQIDKELIGIHADIPSTFQIVPSFPDVKQVTFKMKFDPDRISVSVDEFEDTAQGVSLIIRLYDQPLLRLLNRSTVSILQTI